MTSRPQSVWINKIISSSITLNTGSPQGCVLSSLLYKLFTHDCRAPYDSNLIVKFADDTAVVGLITNEDEMAYRQEVEGLGLWCKENNLILNINKTKEMIVDFRKSGTVPPPLYIDGVAVEMVPSLKYLGVHLSNTLTWRYNTCSIIKKAHQCLYFLRKLKRAGLNSNILSSFYRCAVESGADCFPPFPSGRRLCSIRARTARLKNSFFPDAVRLLNCFTLPHL